MRSNCVPPIVRPSAAGIFLWFGWLLGATPASAEVSCKAWNTIEFFEEASVADVSRCLAGGADVNAKDSHSRRSLHNAAKNSKTPAVIIPVLVKAGADVNAKVSGPVVMATEGGMTPLHMAAASWSAAAAVGALIKAGADVNAGIGTRPCSDGISIDCSCRATPLHTAAWNGETAAVTILVKAGADINARAACGATPLHAAADGISGSAMISALIAAGADPDARDIYERTPLHVAAGGQSEEVVSALIAAGADPDARDQKGNTPLEVARAEVRMAAGEIWEENKRAVAAALSADAIAAVRETAMQAAAADRKRQVEGRLREAQVSCNNWNTSVFFRHASGADVSRCLKTKNANAKDEQGRTPMHLAALEGNPETVAVLAKAGADPNALDGKGRTPLHLVAVFGDTPEAVTALVEAGADTDKTDARGRTPLEFAEKFSETPAVVTALREAVAAATALPARGPSVAEVKSASCENWNTARLFRNASVEDLARCLETEDPNARNASGRTPMHYAAQGASPAFVTALAAAGAELNTPDEKGGWTPLL